MGKPLFRLLCAALMACALPALAIEPLAFKGLALGDPATPITQDPRYDCRNVNTPQADLICTLRPKQQETLAGSPLLSVYYYFDRARLTLVVASFSETHFAAVSTAFENKYGRPDARTESLKTLSGKSLENRTLSWQHGAHQLQAQRYVGQANRSVLRLTDTEAAARIQARKIKPAAQDI